MPSESGSLHASASSGETARNFWEMGAEEGVPRADLCRAGILRMFGIDDVGSSRFLRGRTDLIEINKKLWGQSSARQAFYMSTGL